MSRPEAIFSAVCYLTNTFIKRCVSREPVVFIKREAVSRLKHLAGEISQP